MAVGEAAHLDPEMGSSLGPHDYVTAEATLLVGVLVLFYLTVILLLFGNNLTCSRNFLSLVDRNTRKLLKSSNNSEATSSESEHVEFLRLLSGGEERDDEALYVRGPATFTADGERNCSFPNEERFSLFEDSIDFEDSDEEQEALTSACDSIVIDRKEDFILEYSKKNSLNFNDKPCCQKKENLFAPRNHPLLGTRDATVLSRGGSGQLHVSGSPRRYSLDNSKLITLRQQKLHYIQQQLRANASASMDSCFEEGNLCKCMNNIPKSSSAMEFSKQHFNQSSLKHNYTREQVPPVHGSEWVSDPMKRGTIQTCHQCYVEACAYCNRMKPSPSNCDMSYDSCLICEKRRNYDDQFNSCADWSSQYKRENQCCLIEKWDPSRKCSESSLPYTSLKFQESSLPNPSLKCMESSLPAVTEAKDSLTNTSAQYYVQHQVIANKDLLPDKTLELMQEGKCSGASIAHLCTNELVNLSNQTIKSDYHTNSGKPDQTRRSHELSTETEDKKVNKTSEAEVEAGDIFRALSLSQSAVQLEEETKSTISASAQELFLQQNTQIFHPVKYHQMKVVSSTSGSFNSFKTTLADS